MSKIRMMNSLQNIWYFSITQGCLFYYEVAYSIMRCAKMDYEAMLRGDVKDYNILNEFYYNYHL